MLGVMLDCSRNAVMKVEVLKDYIKILGKMGYNTLMLYTEDTYEVDNEPLFGYMRGRYSKDEIREIDRCCIENGIELVPCIQTLAHLNCLFKWWDYNNARDCDDILLIESERTYELIENMFSSISSCFTSRKIHIGMDEARMVGLGNYLAEHGFRDRFEVIYSHLEKVCEIAKKYHFSPMMWSDMFYSLANGGLYNEMSPEKNAEISKRIPENLSLVYWDYYNNEKETYDKILKSHKELTDNVIFAGGAWTWIGFAPDNSNSIIRTECALKACKDQDVKDVFITSWGDDGSECSKFAVLPSLMYAAEAYRGNYDMDSIKTKFKDIVGVDFDVFMLLDKASINFSNNEKAFSKRMLFNDLFLGISDFMITEDDNIYFDSVARKLDTDKCGKYEYIFNALKCLCETLKIKCDLGVRIRNAYKCGDKENLKLLCGEIQRFKEKLETFYYAFENQWMYENKPFGFEVQDMRFGGLLKRADSCKERIKKYLDGEISSIPELEETIIETQYSGEACWAPNITSNVISHI